MRCHEEHNDDHDHGHNVAVVGVVDMYEKVDYLRRDVKEVAVVPRALPVVKSHDVRLAQFVG